MIGTDFKSINQLSRESPSNYILPQNEKIVKTIPAPIIASAGIV